MEAFVRSRWGRKEGGIRGLAAAVGTSADTVYHWFGGTSSINAYYLGRLAEVLEVKRWEIVAAMDGEEAQGDPLAARVERLEATVQRLEAEGGTERSRLRRRSA